MISNNLFGGLCKIDHVGRMPQWMVSIIQFNEDAVTDGVPLNEDAVMVSHLNPFNLMSIPCVLCYEDAVTVSHLMRMP